MSADPTKMSTRELAHHLYKITHEKTDPMAEAARELAWRVSMTLEQDQLGASEALAFLKAFP